MLEGGRSGWDVKGWEDGNHQKVQMGRGAFDGVGIEEACACMRVELLITRDSG